MEKLNPEERQGLIDDLNYLTEMKWDVLDQLRDIELGRTAIFNKLRDDEILSGEA